MLRRELLAGYRPLLRFCNARTFSVSQVAAREFARNEHNRYEKTDRNRYDRNDRYDKNDRYERNDRYEKTEPNRYGRYNRNVKHHFKKNNNNKFATRNDNIPDLERNKVRLTGKEGDGLRGLEDYVVNTTDLEGLSWEELKSGESEDSDNSFSGVDTLQLAEHKVVSRVLVNSLHYNRKYTQLTPVQAQTILPISTGRSVVVRAKTGTGKTAAFGIPLLQKVYEAKQEGVIGVKALIISPTRELAQQISDELCAITSYGKLRNIRTMCFVGGLSKRMQVSSGLSDNPVDIVVATPGRLIDILQDRQALQHFSGISIKVLDEADRLLDIGFKSDLNEIDFLIKKVHGGKFQTLLFSATTDKNVLNFAEEELGKDNVEIVDTVSKDEPLAQELVSQHSIVCRNWAEVYAATAHSIKEEFRLAKQQKENAEEVAKNESSNFKAIVFLPTVMLVKHFGAVMTDLMEEDKRRMPRVEVVHGQQTQNQRQRFTDRFRTCEDGILITTDVVARGMDFPNVTHVFQMGSTGEASTYIHRIGRTARIGRTGKSILVHTPQEQPFFKALEKHNIRMESKKQFEPRDATDIAELITEFSPNAIAADEFDRLYQSLFAAYEPLKKAYNMNGRQFVRDQQEFAALIGLEDAHLSHPQQRTWLRGHGGAANKRSNNGRRAKKQFW